MSKSRVVHTTTTPPTHFMRIVTALIVVCIQVYFLNYILALERNGCTCALNYRRTYIQWYLIVSILWAIFGLVLSQNNSFFMVFLQVVMALASLVYFLFVWQYVTELKRNVDCKCSEATARTVMFVLSIVYFVVLVLSFLLGVVRSRVSKSAT